MHRAMSWIVGAVSIVPQAVAPETAPSIASPPIAVQHQAPQTRCQDREGTVAFVATDKLRRFFICAHQAVSMGGPWTLTPKLTRLGDTLFVTAIASVPPGPQLFFTEVTNLQYHATFGPVDRGTRLRVTTAMPGSRSARKPALDTVIVVR